VFGPLFRRQDSFRRQCRMPEPPMLLADRVLGIAGEPGSMGKGTCWTESDIRPDAWYLDRGRMPTGLLIEAGQADLLLISWLGVDFLNRDERVYRLLGCEITFHEGDAPRPGETVRFQIHIDGHASLGDTRMFFFRYDARIGERLVSSVRHGQAGFFTDAELASAGGVLWNAAEDQPKRDARLDPALCCTTKRAFSSADVKAFAEGNAYACFGAGFERAAAHQRSPGIPAGRMQLIDCVPEFDPTGGPWGRGYLRAEVDVPTDAWFYAGHFHNDPCMPGTLMAEAATQALKFHMAALGFTIDRDGWVFRPVPGEAYKFICRGQVIPDKPHRVSYEVFVEEIVGGDTPMLFGALLARADGFKVFMCRRFGVKLVPDWPLGTADIVAPPASERRIVSSTGDVPGDHRALLASAWGRPAEAFGSMYARFDGPMRAPRLPGPPYLFMSRVASVDCPPAAATPGGRVIAEYDIPSDAWYFAAGGNATMPFSILSEVLLQPCGWLAAYMGFALPGNLKFRNLDGDDVTVRETITPQTGTLAIEVTFLKSAVAGPMTLVFFEVVCRSNNGVVASLKTDFGFFPPDALTKQKGLPVRAGDRNKLAALSEVDPASLASDLLGNTECAGMSTGMLGMIDGVTGYWPAGGRAQLGRARGRQTIDPNAWYFKAHFFEDPVQAGSLGLEALFNLLKAAVKLKGLHRRVPDPCFETPARGRSFAWKYRGQIVPEDAEVVTEIDLVEVIEERDSVLIIAEGSLWVDGLKIYQVAGYPLRIRPARQGAKPESETVSRIDPVAAPWLTDHCPTYCVPVFPMMGVVAELMRFAERDASGAKLVRLESLEIGSWIRLDEGPVELAFHRTPLPDGRTGTQVFRRSGGSTKETRVGRVIETHAASFPPAPAAWEDDPAGEVIADPYGAGGLFHHGAFAVVPQIIRSASSSSFVLDAGAAVRRAGGGPVVLLDAILHGIPHHCPRLWFGDAAQDFAAFPYRVEHLTLYQPVPTTGMLRVLSRACAMPTPRTIQSEVQVLQDGRVVMEIALVEALVPTSAFERLAPVDRRPFMRERRYTAGFSMAEVGADRTVLELERVTISNWLAGTLEAIYDVAGHPKNLTEAIALKEHFAAKHRLHPAQVRLTETTITPGDAAAITRNAVSAGWVDANTFEVRD
jgi:3-hydroxymyristoyl/3-hydroxydecanoyl-(acyl carrier protein) dehydratase